MIHVLAIRLKILQKCHLFLSRYRDRHESMIGKNRFEVHTKILHHQPFSYKSIIRIRLIGIMIRSRSRTLDVELADEIGVFFLKHGDGLGIGIQVKIPDKHRVAFVSLRVFLENLGLPDAFGRVAFFGFWLPSAVEVDDADSLDFY